MDGSGFSTRELLKDGAGVPTKSWKDDKGDKHLVYRQGDTEIEYVIQGKGNSAKANVVSSKNRKTGIVVSYDTPGDFTTRRVTTPDGKSKRTMRGASPFEVQQAKIQQASQRYQVSQERQSRTAQSSKTPEGGNGGKGKFHGNQYTAHGTEIPVKGKKP